MGDRTRLRARTACVRVGGGGGEEATDERNAPTQTAAVAAWCPRWGGGGAGGGSSLAPGARRPRGASSRFTSSGSRVQCAVGAHARRGRTRLDVSDMFLVHALTVLAATTHCAPCARASRGCARPSLERHVAATATTATRKRRASSEPRRAALRVARPPAVGWPRLRFFGVLVIALSDTTVAQVCP